MSRNVSGVSNASLQQRYDGTFFSILLFALSAIKGPVKELRLLFMLGEKCTKYFYYFQDLRALKCHRTKHSNRMTFPSLILPPAWISRVFDPPSRENFQNPIRRGGGFFLEQPNG